jgi:hypothetical protein
MQWHMGTLENRANADAELRAAIVAFFQAKPHFAFLILDASKRVDATATTTLRANGTVRPNDGLPKEYSLQIDCRRKPPHARRCWRELGLPLEAVVTERWQGETSDKLRPRRGK